MAPLSLLSWNILHGGGTRVPEIALAILDLAPDIIVLSEFRAPRGGSLRAILADHGYTHQASATHGPSGNGMLIAARIPLTHEEPPALTPWGRGRWLHAHAAGLSILGVHVPDDTLPRPKAACWHAIEDHARAHRQHPAVILGDLNTGRRWQDLDQGRSHCEASLGVLASLGYVDAFRYLHPHAREASWVSSSGRGFRIDAALVSGPLRPTIRLARYAHELRVARASDHAPLLVTLEVAQSASPNLPTRSQTSSQASSHRSNTRERPRRPHETDGTLFGA